MNKGQVDEDFDRVKESADFQLNALPLSRLADRQELRLLADLLLHRPVRDARKPQIYSSPTNYILGKKQLNDSTMEYYDYREAIAADIIDAIAAMEQSEIDEIKSLGDRDSIAEHLRDLFWADDNVTGNGGNGTYTMDNWKAEQYVSDNKDLLNEAVTEFGYGYEQIGEWFLNDDFNQMDIAIRCYLLGEAISDYLDSSDSVFGDLDEVEDSVRRPRRPLTSRVRDAKTRLRLRSSRVRDGRSRPVMRR